MKKNGTLILTKLKIIILFKHFYIIPDLPRIDRIKGIKLKKNL